MVTTYDGPLQEAPDVLHRVDVDLVSRVFTFGVIDRFVFCILVCYAPVGFPFVGIDSLHIPGDVCTNEAVQGLAVSAPYYLKADVPIALQRTHNDGLVALVSASLAFDLAAHERLVGFNNPLQELRVYLVKSGADTMAEIPRGLVAHMKGTLELICTYPLLGLYNEVDGQKPLPQRKVRIVEDCASGDGEAVAA